MSDHHVWILQCVHCVDKTLISICTELFTPCSGYLIIPKSLSQSEAKDSTRILFISNLKHKKGCHHPLHHLPSAPESWIMSTET